MSKNLTRKGLALGAVVALGSSLFAGAPAFAAGESINFASTAGTSNKTILGGSFELTGTLASFASAPTELKVLVTGVNAADITIGSNLAPASATAAEVLTARASAASDRASGTAVTSPSSVVRAFTGTETLGRKHIVSIKLGTTVTSTTTVNVQLFVDSVDTNNKIDSGEIASAPVAVTFVKASEVVPTVKIDAPVIGATSVTTHATLGDINLEQIDADQVKSFLTENGAAADNDSMAWVEADAALSATHDTSISVAKDEVYNASIKILGQDGSTYTTVGSAAGLVVATDTAYDVNTVAAVKAVSAGNVSGQSLRAGIKSFDFSSAVTINNSNGVQVAAPAGLAAKVTFTDVDMAATATLTSGSKKIDIAANGAGTSITVDAVTNAAGKVIVPVTLSSAKNGESFSVVVKVVDKTGGTNGYTASTTGTFNSVDAADAIAVAGGPGYGSQVSAVKGGTVTVPFTIYDNFQQVYTAKKYRVTTTGGSYSAGNGANISDVEYIDNGTGSVTFTDNSSAAGTYVLSFVVAEYNTDAADWTGTGAVVASGAGKASDVTVNIVTDNTPSRVTALVSDNGGVIANADFDAVNEYAGEAAYDGAYDAFAGIGAGADAEGESISGNVYRADGTALAGVAVTITGAGLLFGDGGNFSQSKKYSVGSITVYTGANGLYTATYYSHKAGRTPITVTAGSATKTVNSDDFANWTAVGYISSATLTGPASVLPGRSAQYKVQLTDKWGNAVKVANKAVVSYDGAGYFAQDLSATTATSASGTLAYTLIAGATDSGTGTLTVTLSGFGNADIAGNTGAAKDDNIVLAQAITIGAAPVAASATSAVSGSTGKFYVSVTNAAAKKVVVKVAGKFFKSFTGTAAKKTVALKAPKGKHKVTVYVGGKLTTTKTITVK